MKHWTTRARESQLGFGFTSDLSRMWREFFRPITKFSNANVNYCLHSSVNRSRNKIKTNPDSLTHVTFSHALCWLHGFASNFDWLTGLSVSFVICQSDYFGFVFMTLK